MKTLFKFAAALAAIAIIFSCTKENGEDGGKNNGGTSLNQDIEFTLTVSETDATSAKIRVTHNGEREDTWYWFVTTENDINKAVSAKVEDLIKEGDITLQKSTAKNITVKDLEAKTTYTFVVFGLSSEGEVYGTPADIEFTTKADITNLVESDEWTLSYEGREEGKEIFGVQCDENSIYYFGIIDAYYISNEEGEPEYLDDYILMMVEDLQSYLDEGYKADDLIEASILQVGPGQLASSRQASGYYFAFAIGYDADGAPTGTYATSLFEIKPETPTAEYLQWIGTYKVTGANGIYYNLNIMEYDPNFMYVVVGWESGESIVTEDLDGDGYADGLDFNTAFDNPEYDYDYTPAFPTYYNAGKMEINEYFITNVNMGDEVGILGLFGFGDTSGLLYTDQMGHLATATTEDEGATGTIKGETLEFTEGVIEVTSLGYSILTSGYYYQYNEPMELPFTMTRLEDGVSQQSLAFPRTIEKDKFNKDAKVKRTITVPAGIKRAL